MRFVVIFALVFIGICFSGCLTRKESASNQLILNQKEADPDQQVLNQLKQGGANLNKLHNIEFFLYFPTEQVANNAAEEIRKEQLNVTVRLGEDGSGWLCLATKEMVPKRFDLVRLRTRFNEIAQKFKGDYDGWGTEIVK